MKKLSPSEYTYMCLIWYHPEGIVSGEIYKCFPQSIGSKSTILHRIVTKGFVTQTQKGRQVEYRPVISRLEYDQFILTQKLNSKMGLGSISALFATFCGKNVLSEQEKEKLNLLIDQIQSSDSEGG